ncbi:TonB-linked SusC/RagA family outer membrane protein [Maribacter vaceletii]|uniref:TonB-linked SusC/RagA family outer membrane protein n=1 Tax=Maribacter vaceletii TaxID=1206816 RepID=A0A495ECA7_9FLAO|nr:TonB-dependent receptor [Maribacter vaceletii]RKR14331.1 TonB-linked SusC/RagA family outer membrane protein [Maribacter vaceletii]
MKRKHVYLIFFFCCSAMLWSQEKIVNGSITDSDGVPLPGANVVEVGTTNGTQSDFDGNYQITVNQGASLSFSYIGMVSQTIVVSNQENLNVALQEDAAQLDEVVVVGYGTQKVVNLTGSVEVVKAAEITRQPVAQASQALAGLVPGLTATQSSGQPGGDNATLRIRGVGTLGNGAKNNPLVLIDGIPDDINGLDPSDIESISVLKDASAAAIYGSRAANGVILVTTKRGKEGRISTSYNTYIGVQSIAQNLQFLDALGYMEAFNSAQPGAFPEETLQAYRNGDGVGTEALPNTDWVDLLFSSAAIQQYHSISVRGGSEKAKMSSSISYTDQDGNVPNFNFKRYNGRFNLDFKLSEKIDLAFDLNFRREDRKQPGELNSITRSAYRLQPLFVAINDDGTNGQGFSGGNPVAYANSTALDQTITNYFRGLVKATYRPFNNFSISATYAPQYTDRDQDNFQTGFTYYEFSGGPAINRSSPSLEKETFTSFQDNFNAIMNYSKDFGNHSVSALAGYEILKFQSETWGASRKNYVLDDFRGLDNGDADTQLNYGSSTLNGLESLFGRINYSYKDKYLLEANVRRDASSRFAPGFRSATFPSFSLGWVASQEGFLQDSETINFLKFRASWGQLGNQFVYGTNADGESVLNNFVYTSLFGLGNANPTIGGVPITGGAQETLSNPELRWETGETQNIGFDAKLFQSKLSLTGEYYVRKTKDILLDVTIPSSTGLLSPAQNAGEVWNTGYDLSIGWQDMIGENFRYGFNFNYSDFKNEIKNLGGLDQLPPGNRINRVGEEIGAIHGLKVEGLYQESDFDSSGALNPDLPTPGFGAIQAGDIKYADISGPDGVPDGEITNDDRTIIGSDIANKNWGLELFTEYKNIDLSISLLGSGGRDIVLQGDAGYAFFNAGKIQEWQADYWTPTNTNAAYPRLHPASSHPNWRTNETWMHDASYVRLRNITLGYNLSRDFLDKISLSRARIYLSGQNLATWDNMPEGIDPLTPQFSSGAFYPVTKVFSLGLNVTF